MAVRDVVASEELAEPSSSEVTWRLPEGDELPEGWMLTQLSEVCETGARSLSPQDSPHEVFEYYSIPAFQETGTPAFETGERILSNKLLVERGAVLFGKLNPRVLKVWMVNPTGSHRAIASTEFLPMLANDKAAPEFLFYLCHSGFVVQEAMRMVNGSTPSRQRVDPKSFYRITIPLPPLPEQRAIARVLRSVQDAIQTRRHEVELERERKAALMQQLFTRGTLGEPTKQTEIGEMPKSWQVVPLGRLCHFLQYGTSERCEADTAGKPVLRIPNVIDGGVNIRDLKYAALPDSTSAALRLFDGDLLFVRTNGRREYAGRCAVFHSELDDALFASYLIRARLKPDTAVPDFVQMYTMTSMGRAYLSGRASNAADGKFNINTQTIKTVQLPLPSVEEQGEIIAVLLACGAVIAALDRELQVLEELFRALLEKLMTGRLSALPLVEAADNAGISA